MTAAEPRRITVVRHQCPWCSHSRASRKSVWDHMGTCPANPALFGCSSCRFFAGMKPVRRCHVGMPLAHWQHVGCPRWSGHESSG